jgi:hypothetical protein
MKGMIWASRFGLRYSESSDAKWVRLLIYFNVRIGPVVPPRSTLDLQEHKPTLKTNDENIVAANDQRATIQLGNHNSLD